MSRPFNLAAHVLSRGAETPDKAALEVLGPDGSEAWSYARLIAAVRGTATGLRDMGLAPGDRVVLRLGNSADFPIAYLGAIAAGIVPVPTSSQLTGPEITRIAAEIGPALTLAEGGVALPDDPGRVLPAAEARAFHELPPAEWNTGDPERPAYIIYTSGTSGRPRAVVHAHRAILGRTFMVDGWTGLTADDRLLHAGAFNWTYTLGTGLMDPWTMGATALIPGAATAPTALPRLLADHGATIFAAAPGVFRQMLRTRMPALPRLRHALSAGEKLPEGLRDRWRAATGTEIHEAYGMSECSTFVSGAPTRPAPAGTLGHPQAGRCIALRGGADDYGTIAVHRSDPGLFLGYLDQPEETAARFDGDWFLTGDIARRGPDGALVYEGRADDMMNAGGYRVSPVEVEEALAAHPGVTEAAAVEVRVKADATVIAAFWTGPEPLDEAALAAHASERLARYKCPRLYVRVDALPRGANNKLLRKRLKTDWEARHGEA
ncbi:class I adenylate-forming enzyme family protein [Wenxinia marina]|uniref:Acyl-CoA synthetase (AMP-forming)/AMP-acid ligase II n=1 Tax=Wenxinia marina DSM 24838 TaxID=1123501 RepID=A0A0D0QA81_9RHOB|nr:class I adenylate-forming enzyme family protein [Wenxinia marina]KIQ67913.1 Acyl-CoA synthetase (AMP-forming)/AMP-acid ligase II [Wenxinia marina DSM 24838]GGL74160.1 acetyl-CoA synthetase [Wenxinia marina]